MTLVWLALSALIGCSGGEISSGTAASSGQTPEAAAPAPTGVEAALIEAAWPVQLATREDFERFASAPGWVALLVKRDYLAATKLLGQQGGMDEARGHADLAVLYRQAALLSANSLIQTYAETPEPSDPIGVTHLLTVSYALTGQLDQAKAAGARFGAQPDPALEAWHAPWRNWLAAGAVWPPDLTGLPVSLGPPAPGSELPQLPPEPHYRLQEQGVETTREMGDPGALLALAFWHDQAAAAAAGDKAAQVRAYQAPYLLPAEGPVQPGADAPIELLFGAERLTPADVPFLADLHGAGGLGAVDTYRSRSLIAAAAAASRVNGAIDAERAGDVAARVRDQLLEASKARTQGTVEGHQRTFVEVGYVGLLRGLALVAEKEGNREVSGRLRIQAMERSTALHSASPEGLMALAAWDAANRYPSRALDIVHNAAKRYPSLEIARFGLNVMALRVSRERPGETPGM